MYVAFGASGAVVAQLQTTARGAGARVVAVDEGGAIRWRTDLEGETRVRADHRSDRVAVVHAGTVTERSASGAVVRSIGHAADARYDEDGHLVVVHDDGTVRWH